MVNPVNNNPPTYTNPNQNPFGPITFPLGQNDSTNVVQSSTILSLDVLPSGNNIPILEYSSAILSAALKQAIQDLQNALANPQYLSQLANAAGQQAIDYISNISKALTYDKDAAKLNTINLAGAKQNLVNAEDDFNQKAGALNTAINTYNSAQTNYENALTSYDDAVNTYQQAQSTYDTALSNWNAALAAHNAAPPTITDAQFQQAQSDYKNAQTAFNAATTTYQSAKTSFDDKQTQWKNAQNALKNAQNNYENSLNALNLAIQKWNTVAQQANDLINEMNALNIAPSIQTVPENLPLADDQSQPPAEISPDPRDTVGIDIASFNNTDNNTTGPLINSVNSEPNNPLNPPYNPIPQVDNLTNDIPNNSQYQLYQFNISTVSGYPVTQITLPTFSIIDTQTSASQNTSQVKFLLSLIGKQSTVDQGTRDVYVSRHTTTGGSGSSVAIAAMNNFAARSSALSSTSPLTSNPTTTTTPPLAGVLSTAVFEAYFNQFGVPLNTPLLDQIGALYENLKIIAGLTSVSAGQEILGSAATQGPSGDAAINATIALGLLRQFHNMVSNNLITPQVLNFINQNPQFAGLTDDQKTALAQGLGDELQSSLLKSALTQIANTLNQPGLIPQILQIATGTHSQDPLASLQSQIFEQFVLSNLLAKQFNISDTLAQQIAQQAFQQTVSGQVTGTTSNVVSFIADKIQQAGVQDEAASKKIQQALDLANARLIEELQKTDLAKTQAFKETLTNQLNTLGYDPARLNELLNALEDIKIEDIDRAAQAAFIGSGLSAGEISQVLNAAHEAANAKDPDQNPLSSFLAARLGTKTELSALLKQQILNVYTPVIGATQALQVAVNYGNLIFTDPNSVTNILQNNESHLKKLDKYNSQQRQLEDYTQIANSYLNQDIPSAELNMGKTILLLGQAGGPSTQGILTTDNTLGPVPYSHPIQFQG